MPVSTFETPIESEPKVGATASVPATEANPSPERSGLQTKVGNHYLKIQRCGAGAEDVSSTATTFLILGAIEVKRLHTQWQHEPQPDADIT